MIYIERLNELIQRLEKIKNFTRSERLKSILEDGRNQIEQIAKNLAPKKTWKLEGSIKGEIIDWGTDNPGIKMRVNSPYALWVEERTKPHNIPPRNKRLLRWAPPHGEKIELPPNAAGPKGIETVYSKGVPHPGTKAQPFLKPAVDRVRPRLLAAILKAMEEELSKE